MKCAFRNDGKMKKLLNTLKKKYVPLYGIRKRSTYLGLMPLFNM